ncbi:MAG: helix-hairpin-helix domain-containing protein [Candidatus Aenigmatarchaeota archaeon]
MKGDGGISIVSTSNTTVSNVPENDYFSWPHETGEGEDKVMIVAVSWASGSAEGNSVMYGSEILNKVYTENADGDVRTEIWLLSDPNPSGGIDYVEVGVESDDADDVIAGALTLSGVDQDDPTYDIAGNTVDGTSISVDVNSRPLDMVVDVVGQSAAEGEGAPTADQTVQWSSIGGESGSWGAAGTKEADSGTTTMSWDLPTEEVTSISAVTLRLSRPDIIVTNPEAGDEWEVGTEKEIRWKTEEGAGDIVGVDLEYSVDAGNTWYLIDGGLDDTGAYTWQVPDENSQECHIRAVVHDENDRQRTNISGQFAIGSSPAPPENVTVEHWGDPVHPPMMVFDDFSDGDYTSDPAWTVYDGDWDVQDQHLEGQGNISTDEGLHRAYGRWEYNFSLENASWENNPQIMRFYFIQRDDPDPGVASGYYMSVVGEGGEWWDSSINLFRQDMGATEYLAGGDWDPDTDWHTIAVERNNNDEFTIYFDGQDMGSIIDSTYTTSEYMGILSQGATAEDDHKIDEIRMAAGQDNRITWDASPDDPDYVDHYNIYRSEERDGPWNESTYLDNVTADGSPSYEYIDAGSGEADDTYWWYVVRSVGEIEEDNEDVVREPGPPEVDVLIPDGGEVWEAYSEELIEWNMTEGYTGIDHVNIYSSSDGGRSWDEVVMGLALTDNHTWTVSNYNSSECLVKVEAVDLDGRADEAVSDDYFTILGEAPQPPENLNVEHADPVGELVENGIFMDDYEPWNLTRLQFEGDSRWHENSYQADGSGSIYSNASQSGGGVTTEEAYWEQDIKNTSSQVTLNGAYNKNIQTDHQQCNVSNATVEILVNDTQDGWQTIYADYDNADQNSGWIEFGPDATYQPTGKVVSVRAYMKVVAEGFGNNELARGELWMDNISVVSEGSGGDDHNLVSWDASPDDPDEVAHYNIYRSKDRDGPWDETALIANVTADGSPSYTYLDEDKGMVDDIYWWYVVRAVGENGLEENNTKEKQEPFIVDYIEVTPQDSTITAGDTQAYNATAYDQNGNEIREVTDQTSWSDDVEPVEASWWDQNEITVEKAGNWTVTGEYEEGGGTFTDTANLNVEPGPAVSLSIEPQEATITAGGSETYTATAEDEYGNEWDVTDQTSWSDDVEPSGASSWNQNEITVEKAGNWTVTGEYEGLDDTANLTVMPAPAESINIEPQEATITAGGSETYTATAEDQYGNQWNVTEQTNWSDDVEPSGASSWNQNEITVEKAGNWTVTGEYEGLDDTANLTVMPAPAESINIEPQEATITAGGSETYTATAEDQYGNQWNVTEQTNWSDDVEPVEASWWDQNEITVEEAGNWTLTAEFEGLEDTANLTVEPAEPASVEISPQESTIETGQSQEYTAAAYDEFDNEIEDVTEDVNWSIEEGGGGEWEQNVYHSENPGEWTVTGTYSTGGLELQDEALLNVLSTGEVWVDINSPKEGETVSEVDVTVEWDSGNADHHEVRLNENGWIDVGMDTTYTFENLSDGAYTAEVKAVSNDTFDQDEVNFTVDTGLPSVEITSPDEEDEVPPDVTVTWNSENAGYHEIRLDSTEWLDIGQNTSHTFQDLDAGDHTVEVKAVKGDNSMVDTVNFTVNPDVIYLEIYTPEQGDIFSEGTVTVEWDSSNVDYHEVKIEGRDWIYLGAETSYTFDGLDDGEFKVEVKGTNEADETIIDEVTFMVDTTSPTLHIIHPDDGETFGTDTVTIEWEGDDEVSGIDRYEIRLDENGWIEVDGTETSHDFGGLIDGEHEVSLRAYDTAENMATDTVQFRVDCDPPSINITEPTRGEAFREKSITIEWEGGDELSGIDRYEIRLDESAWTDVGARTSHDFDDLNEGEREIEVRAIDSVGNRAKDSISFMIDTTPPSVEIENPENDEIFNVAEVSIDWSAEDSLSGVDYYEVRIDEGNDGGWSEWQNIDAPSYIFEDTIDGEHTVEVRAVDRAGNTRSEDVYFLVDTTPPEIEIISPDGVIDEDSVTTRWECNETLTGIDYFQVIIEGNGVEVSGEQNEYSFDDLSDGEYELEIRAVDNAGNVGNESIKFEVDTSSQPVSRIMNTSCLLPLLLLIIIAVLLIVGWYGWKRRTEREEEPTKGPEAGPKPTLSSTSKSEPTSLQKRSSIKRRKVMTKSRGTSSDVSEVSAGEKRGTSVSGVSAATAGTAADEKKSSEESEVEAGDEDQEPEEPKEMEEEPSEPGAEELETEEEDKLDVVQEFQEIKGVGSGIAHALYEAGYHSKEDLGEAGVEDIRDIDGIGFTQAELIHESIQKDEKEEKDHKAPEISEEDLKGYQVGPIIKGREMKKGSEEKSTAPEVKESDFKTQQIDSRVFEEEAQEMEEETEETVDEEPAEVPEEKEEEMEVSKEDALDELSQIKGVGTSKAEKLYENGFRSLEDLKGVSKEELQDIKGIGPTFSEMIVESVEEMED